MHLITDVVSPYRASSVYRLLDVGIHLYHLVVQVRMLSDHDLRIPSRCYEDRIDTTAQGRRKDITDLKSNQKRKSDHDRCIATIVIVGGLGEQ